jgi:hypothetical protein
MLVWNNPLELTNDWRTMVLLKLILYYFRDMLSTKGGFLQKGDSLVRKGHTPDKIINKLELIEEYSAT